LKYIYFVSYFNTTKNGFGFGRCRVTSDEKIECFDDIEYLEKELLKDKKECNEITIINYQLMQATKKRKL
jgi:hypothetical protein